MTLLEKLNHFPPVLCRFVARSKDGRKGKTAADIARDSGLKLRRVYAMSKLRSWDTVTIADAVKFSHGCGVDLLRLRRHLFHLRHHKKIHAIEQYDYLRNILTRD